MLKIKLLILLILITAVGLFVYHDHQNQTVNAAATNTANSVKQTAKSVAAATKPAAPNACAPYQAQTILVSLSQQHLWACNADAQVYDTPVTTGATAYDDGTPTGTWKIYAKETDQYLTGSDSRGSWDDFVNYWMPFYGAYGFHDATWQTFPFGSLTQYATGGSHGCVHLPLTAMKWLYDWAPVGTSVTIEA